jgi:hypothetical protein
MADRPRQALDRFGQVAIAFDELIVQVGRAIARAQQSMDLAYIDFQRQIARGLTDGTLRHLDVVPASTYSMPETKLDLRIGLSMRYPEGGDTPELSAVPLNAATTNQSDIDVEASTTISLRFLAVPQGRDTPAPPASALTAADVQAMIAGDPRLAGIIEALGTPTQVLDYAVEERLWLAAFLDAREPALVVLVDDREKVILTAVARSLPPSEADLAPVGHPALHGVEPRAGRQGQILTVTGDDFLTLAGQSTLMVDGRPVPLVRHTMRSMAFKVPAWATRGDLEIVTPLGRTGEAGKAAFTPLPGFIDVSPRQGYFDTLQQRGTWIAVTGSNLRPGCTIRFATGALGQKVEIVSPARMQVEVPEHAGTGPLTLVFTDPATGEVHEQSLPEPFVVLPRVHRVTPRQATVGAEITLLGNSLAGVTEVRVGLAPVTADAFTLHTPGQIRFRVPVDATDGPIRVRVAAGATEPIEIASRDIFYVVPRITGFVQRVVVPGQLLTVRGEGLDPDPSMMTLLFDARTGISEAPVLGVASDRRSFLTRVPEDAVTGYVLLLRKRIYSSTSPADTSNTADNKLTVLAPQGAPSDLVLEDRFDAGALDLARWTVESGAWRVEDGLLVASGTGRLGFRLPEVRSSLAIYTDALQAERLGISLVATGQSVHRQMWLNLTSAPAVLTWSTLDARGQQVLLASVPLALVAGGNHFVSLVIAPAVEPGTLAITVSIDQEPVSTHVWPAPAVAQVALLSDSAAQRWDNVVILKGDYLRVPEPDIYRFGTLPEPPDLPPLSVSSFAPRQGPPGTQVALTGQGLDEASQVFFGGVPASLVAVEPGRITVEVPAGALTGPIEVRGRAGVITTTRPDTFTVPPVIVQVVPSRVLVGDPLSVIGTNLPTEPGAMQVEVLGRQAEIVSATASMVTVLVPAVGGTGATGPVVVRHAGLTAEAPMHVEVRRETVVLDLLASAGDATWTSAAGGVVFGRMGEGSEPGVLARASERLEDDASYGPVLILRPPGPSLRALRGVYPAVDVPAGPVELRLDLGMLWSSAPAPDDATEVDGVLFEVIFTPSAGGDEVVLLPRTACVHDGSLERFVIDAADIRGQRGQLALSIFPGRSGLRDDAAVVSGVLVHIT